MKQKGAWILMALVLLLSLCPVGSAASSSEESNGEFIFVCPIVENEYWEACIEGIRQADAELGTHTQVVGPLTADNFAVEIIGHMEQAIEAHPDGIMTYAGIEGLFPLIDEAVDKGIPVLAVDSDAPSTKRVAYVGTSAYNAGYQAGETMVELTGGHAKLGVLVSSLSAEKEMQVLEAFLDAVHDYDIEVVATGETNADPDISEAQAREMLSAHPEITAMFNTAGYSVTGAARVKKEQGLDDLVLVGFDDVPENVQFVREGVINAILVQQVQQMGYRSVYLMKECVDNGGLPRESYDTGTILVTKENVDSYANVEQASQGSGKTVRVGYYYGDSSFQDGFADDQRKSGYAYEYYMAISALTGWKYEYIYGSRTESFNRLRSGEVDVVAGVYQTNAVSQDIAFSKYDMGLEGEPRYFAVNGTRSDLLTELDNAMEYLRLYSPSFATSLYQKYYSSSGEQVLSDSERTWLSEMGILRVGYVRSNLPISDQGEDGTPIGVAGELMDAISDYLRITLDPICYENCTQMEEGLRQGEIDMAFPVYSDLWLNESKGFLQTDSFISERAMLIYQGSYSDGLLDRVGLSNMGLGQRYYLQENYPQVEPTFYGTREDVFDAIQKGEVGCIIGCSSVMQYFLSSHREYKDMNVAYLPTSEDFGIAVRQGDSVLVGVLNKAIRQMDDARITNAIVSYSNVTTEPTLVDFLQRYVVVVVAVFILFFSVLLFTFLAYRKRSIEFNREQARTQAKLEEALQEAETASRSKTAFLSSMSHDIRTPMNAIVGMTSIAAKHLDNREKVEDCLKKISQSSHHLLTLINDVLDISKIESGKLTLNPVNFSLRDAITSLVNIVRPQIKAKDLHFDAHIYGIEHEVVYADEVRVNQIFINILTNAVKYTPEGGRIVMDVTQEVLPGGERVRLIYTVSDNGIGMSEEFMANMYETFSRAKDTRINKIQGTGLGLSIVKQMVDLMGGTIECRSKEGEGTTFVITLEFPVAEENWEKLQLPGVHVLVVDDDEIFLETIQEMLLELGAVPETVCSGYEALERLKMRHQEGNDFSVAIVDWKMPGMDGIETVKAIQKVAGEEKFRLPTILASAYDWSDIEDEIEASGANGFINKLLFPSYIYEKLCEILADQEKHIGETVAPEKKFEGMHVLVAEDNDLNWEVLAELLNMYGITTQHAEDGKMCVDMLTEAPEGTYDLILMDVQMPVMNGREATKVIRASQIPHVRKIPIIAMTAEAFAEDIAACLAAGMDGHVAKPVDMEKLFQEIDKVISA